MPVCQKICTQSEYLRVVHIVAESWYGIKIPALVRDKTIDHSQAQCTYQKYFCYVRVVMTKYLHVARIFAQSQNRCKTYLRVVKIFARRHMKHIARGQEEICW